MQYASNAVLAKARAMYAGHLTGEEYRELTAAKNISELIDLLRRKKRYANVLSHAPQNITAAQAEELLRMSIFEQLFVLCRYEISGGQDFYRLYIVKKDIEEILRCIRLLIGGRPQEYLAVLPPYFNKLTELNLIGLSAAVSMEEVLQVLSGTPYRKILEPYAPFYTEDGVFLRIEAAFYHYLCTFITQITRHDRSDKKQVSEVLQLYLDSEYITGLYRLKKLKVHDDEIYRGYLSEEYTAFSKRQIAELTAAVNEKEFMAALATTAYGEALRGLDYGDTEQIMENYVSGKYRKGLRFYTDPAAILICYMYLAENEVLNLVRVIEGKRYGVAPEKIFNVLTGQE